ncbi:MAG: beta-glucuronidase [Mediterranea sp.]|nr:beta-glucuronidase [Mediterranea sp.]
MAVLFISLLSFAQTAKDARPLLQNVYGRAHSSLNGYWNYLVDPLETGYYDYRRRPTSDGFFKDHQVDNIKTYKEYDFDTSPVMPVPGDWNTFADNLFLYEGTLWFRRQFQYVPKAGTRVYLYFAGANYDTKVYLNGEKAGEHEGGYTPFNLDVTDLVKPGRNSLVVKVDDKRRADAVPTNNFDWFNYGGITRDVLLVELPQTFIQSYKVQLKKGSDNVLEMKAWMSGKQAGQKVEIEIPELKVKRSLVTDATGYASAEVKATPKLWSPENPKLYAVKISSATDAVTDELGFRTIETRGREIWLNGKSIFLKGISIHEEAAFRNGRVFSAEEDLTLLSWAKELGCNYVRLAHYPHNEQMVRLAEKMGLLVWSEIPVYWTIHWEKDYVFENALNQLDEMIERDQNRANVFVWSIANETPHGDARDKFLSSLARHAREKDDTRLISMAMERNDKSKEVLSIRDNMSQYVDIVSVNQYVGWYDGLNEKIDRVRWEVDYDKPLMISEFGGGAVAGYHGEANQIWTEEYQAELYRKTLKMIDERMGYVAGISPWVLKDFRSSRRLLPNIQDGFNRKGVISDRGLRKQAFYVLRDWYSSR